MKTIHFIAIVNPHSAAKTVFGSDSIYEKFYADTESVGHSAIVEVHPNKIVLAFDSRDIFDSQRPRILERCAAFGYFVEVVSRHIPETEPVRDSQ